ncbi:MAG: hypothetical protein ABEJ58_07740 [Halodesulfurarchaeum sp.]
MDLPEFELDFHIDEEDPKTVTVFDPSAEETSAARWITIDSEHAVPLETIR